MRSLSIFTLLAASCSFANAALITINCPLTNNSAIDNSALVTGGTTSVTCGGFDAGSGFSITNLSLTFLGSFTDTANNANHQLTFSGSSILGSFGAYDTGINFVQSNTGLQTGVTPGTPGTQTYSPFVVTVTTATVGGLTLPDSGIYTVRAIYTYEANQQQGTPEPSTLALVGGVLVLAGIRKFRK